MIALLPLFALFLRGEAAASSILLEDMESFDIDMMAESMTSDTAELRQGPPPLPPLCPRSAQPNVTSVVSVTGDCTYTLPSSLLRKGGKYPYIPAALNISAPNGTKECILTISSDGPGTTAFIVKEFPQDAQMSLEGAVIGTVPFIRVPPVLVGIGRTSTTFKYSSASGGAIFINVFAVCFRGCHEKITVAPGITGTIKYPSKGKGGRGKRAVEERKRGKPYKPICEYWFTAPSGSKVLLDFIKFRVGRPSNPCGKVRMVFAGDKFFDEDTQSECGKKKGLEVTSTTNEIYTAIIPGRRDMVYFKYSAV